MRRLRLPLPRSRNMFFPEPLEGPPDTPCYIEVEFLDHGKGNGVTRLRATLETPGHQFATGFVISVVDEIVATPIRLRDLLLYHLEVLP